MAPKHSAFRGPNAQHFQLVHRSLQDPLINDPEASQRVLKPMARGNNRKAEISLADLEATVDKSKIRANEGEAALYGITYDDSAYDYMQHLKPVGRVGAESFLIAAPKGGSGVAAGMKVGQKGKGKASAEDMIQLPDSVLPSKDEMSLQEARARTEAIPSELQGFQPDMDPHLRQVLEALDDDAFVDDEEEEEGWFDELVKGGERQDPNEVRFEFSEWGLDEAGKPLPIAGRADDGKQEETWEDRFRAFKQQQERSKQVEQASQLDSLREMDPDEISEMADTVGSLTNDLADMMVKGGKKRRGKRGPSDASGMSMSSSSMFRNQGLTDLDDRFDKVAKDYSDDDDDEEYEDWSDDDGTASIAASNFSVSSRFSLASHASRTSVDVPPEVSREDFNNIMDDFLANYEVVGRRLRPALGGTGLSGPEKLKILRSAIEGEGEHKEDNRKRIKEIEIEDMNNWDRVKLMNENNVDGDKPKWDVESILSTYTNTENHPLLIRSKKTNKSKTIKTQSSPLLPSESDDDGSGSETEREGGPKAMTIRSKGETAEEKKARKATVKAERNLRRAEKKNHKETFATERKRQIRNHNKMVGNGRAADVPAGREGVFSLSHRP
ncbi:hypothetical protein L204_104919 [Cryptococcus depauperatus]